MRRRRRRRAGRRVGQAQRAFLPARGEQEQEGEERGAYHPRIMNESDFHRAVEEVLARIESAAETSDALDVDLESGILTLECPDGTRIIVNRQTPNREIWVAARSGGFHFRFVGGAWRDTRSGEELFAALAALVRAQAGVDLAFE